MKIEIVSVKTEFFDICSFDKELLHNKNQAKPHLIVISAQNYLETYEKGQEIKFSVDIDKVYQTLKDRLDI